MRNILLSGLMILCAMPAMHAQKKALDKPVYKVDPFWPKPLPN